MTNAYISGVGQTKYGKRKETLHELMAEAISKSLDDSDIKKIDAVFVGTMAPEAFVGISNISTNIADYCGLNHVPAIRVGDNPAAGSIAFHQAFYSVCSGFFDNVLVVAGEKMTNSPTPVISKILGGMLSENERKSGATATSLAALVARRYMYEYGLDRETLALVAIKNHANGCLNPNAHFQKEVTLEKIISSRIISSPLTIYDCSPISDGAAAVVLSRKKSNNSIKVKGVGHSTYYLAVNDRKKITEFKATNLAAQKAYKMAKITNPLNQIDVAEIHDAFTIAEIMNSEDLGIFKKGEGGLALKKGITQIVGEMPINPSGGLKAKGHPVGATGLGQICEITWQLRNEAGKRQVNNPKTGLSHNIGGFGNNITVTIMEVC